jgi:uncharacterized protein (DUF983 family)
MSKLPPIQTVKACPHCGGDQFFVVYVFSGKGEAHHLLNGEAGADSSGMHDGLKFVPQVTAKCSDCKKAIGRWDESKDGPAYS